ncbi:MAG: hypothetical protein KDA96_20240, partial [Planctomycetaceae bacterium]|nr:hypothetical protein [Planctomycetaceae bacterium]
GVHAVVGHDVSIGEETVISTGAYLLGRCRIGRRCWLGAGAIISNAMIVGDDANVRLGAVVIQNVADNSDVSGNFASDHGTRLRHFIRQTAPQVH